MATTYQSDMAEQGRGFTPFPQGTVAVRRASYEIGAALVINDVIEMIPVYEGERVVDLRLIIDDVDTNGTPLVTIDVGDGVDPDRYVDGSTIGRTGGTAGYASGVTAVAAALLLDYSYPADDTIDVKFVAAPATSTVVGTVILIATVVHA